VSKLYEVVPPVLTELGKVVSLSFVYHGDPSIFHQQLHNTLPTC